MKALKLFWNYVICGREQLPRPHRKTKSICRAISWQESLNQLSELEG